MGSITQAIRNTVGVADEAQIKERLQLLLVAAKAKIRQYKDEINDVFLNPAGIERTQIPGIRAIKYIEQYHVASSSGFSDTVSKHLDEAIDAFFSIGGNTDTKQAVQHGIKALITTALDAFIGSTEAGENEEQLYIVVPENNAFIRADIRVWKYQMASKSLSDNNDSAVAYILCKSVIDHTKLKIDELIYLVSEQIKKADILSREFKIQIEAENKTATPPTPAKYRYLRAVLNSDGSIKSKLAPNDPTKKYFVDQDNILKQGFNEQDAKIVTPDPGSTLNDYINANLELLTIEGGEGGGTPPSLAVVEAYIEELVRVWKKLKSDDE